MIAILSLEVENDWCRYSNRFPTVPTKLLIWIKVNKGTQEGVNIKPVSCVTITKYCAINMKNHMYSNHQFKYKHGEWLFRIYQ